VSLLDEASFRAASGRRYTCRIAAILKELDEADRATLRGVLASDISNDAIARTLAGVGHPISGGAVRNHRAADHRCPG
jgi:hypothetical protein